MARRSARLAALAAAVCIVAGASAAFFAGRDDQSGSGSSGPSYNEVGLPPVHTDPCPAAGELLATPATGAKTLPDVSLECIGAIGSTDTIALRRLGGVPTVVNLWASWCDPCKQEMPDLQQVYAAARGKVRIIGINTKDARDGARAALANTGVTYPSLADPAKRVWTAAGGRFLPTTLFVDASGHVVFTNVGPMDDKQLRDLIAEHLGVRL